MREREKPKKEGRTVILTFDVGNGSIVMCCVEDGERLALRECTGSIIASVVPQLTPVVCEAAERCTGCRALLVGPGLKSGLNIRMDDPTELGGDLVAAAVAALERFPLPCILVDMGAATAVGVLDAKGSYIGGLICPGLTMGLKSLSRDASQLSDISLLPPKRLIGRNTRESMLSGVIFGAAAMLDGLIERIEAELGERASVVVTGDGAEEIVHDCRCGGRIVVDGDLVMRGLWRIYCRNREWAKKS